MNSNTAWNLGDAGPQVRRLAEEAAHRAGMSLEEWLNEAMAAGTAEAGPDEAVRGDPAASPAPRERVWLDETEDFLESTVTRIERRLKRGEERMARAFETVTRLIEQAREDFERSPPSSPPAAPLRERETAAPARTATERPPSGERRRLDERLEDIARRIEAARRSGEPPAGPPELGEQGPRLDPAAPRRPMQDDWRRPQTGAASSPASDAALYPPRELEGPERSRWKDDGAAAPRESPLLVDMSGMRADIA